MEDIGTKIIAIFYSWQSDRSTKSNKNLISEALQTSSSRLESERPGYSIIIDESTSNLPGSPNIVSAIFNKIGSSGLVMQIIE